MGPFAAPKTTETYTAIVARYAAPYLGEKRLDAFTVSDIRQWLHHLPTSCQCCSRGKDASRRGNQRRCCALARCCDQRLGHRSVLDARAVLRSALTEAVVDQIITHNPAAVVRLRGPRSRRMSVWSTEQARQFLASARDDHDPHYPAYLLLLYVGLRRGELLALQWTDIDMDAATVQIHSELQRVGGRLVLSDTKTLDSEAGLPLPTLCLSALRDQMPSPTDALSRFVVSTRNGGPVEPRNFYRSFQNRVAQADVPRIALHGTRHTCASLLVELDVYPRIAMQILRHAKIATTMDVYSHVAAVATRTAVSQLGLALS